MKTTNIHVLIALVSVIALTSALIPANAEASVSSRAVAIAKNETRKGVHERRGDNIARYRNGKVTPYGSRGVAWSQYFVNWVVRKAGGKAPNTGYIPAYLNWAKKHRLVTRSPRVGAVAVMARAGFVGIVTKVSRTTVQVVGGNVGNSVRYATFSRRSVNGYVNLR